MDSDEAILRLIEKIGSSIGEIQIRSISTLLTKISVGILPFTRLANFPMLPGVLLQWINSGNHGKSESLLKVLSILYQFARTEEGLEILREYECLEFTEELRTSLLTHDKNVQEYADIADKIIKALLPLGRVPQRQTKDETDLKSKQGSGKDQTDRKTKDGTDFNRREESSISLDIVTLADSLERAADEKLYRFMIEVKHGRKELQLQSLSSILSLVRYYGEYSFRYRAELVKEVCYCIECGVYPHLCSQILENLFCSSRVPTHCAEDVLIDARAGEITAQKVQTTQIELGRAVFSTVYSHRLYARLVDHCLAHPNKPMLGWLLQLQYKFAYSPFFRLLSSQKMGDHTKSTLKTLGYYCEAFPQCRRECMELMGKWGLRVEEVPVLQQFAMTQTVESAYLHLSGYGEEYEVGKHLHEMSELIENLDEGIEGIPHLKRPSLQLKIYFETLMVLTVSVSRQDPLMMHYTQLIKVIHRIAATRTAIKIPFFEELLGFTSSFDTITYCGKKFVKAQIMVLFIEQQLPHLFQCSLAHQDCSLVFLQTLKKALGMSARLGGLLGRYSTVLYALSHHQNENIGSLANLLLSKVPKKLKMMTAIMQVFSREQERRAAVAKELFQRQCDPLHGMEECKGEKGEKGRKPLKVSVQSIKNLVTIVLQKQLEQAVRVSAGEELIEMLERAERSAAVQNQVESMRESILAGISGEGHPIRCVLFRIIENIRKMSGEVGVAPEVLLSYLISIPQAAEFQLARRAVLSLLYVSCFQSPFSRTPCKHYSMLCYPHVQMADLPIQQSDIPEEVAPVAQSVSSEQGAIEMGSFKGYCESVTRRVALMGSSWLVGQPHFVQQIEKQVGVALHHQVEDQLHLVSYLVKGSSVPPQSINQLASTLSNALLSRDAHPLAREILHLLSLFRLKPNKQIRSILAEREGVLKLAASLSELESDTLAALMRKVVDTAIQKVLLLRTVLRNLKNVKLREWQEYTRALLFGLVLRGVKSEDGLLRRTSLVLARELVAVRDHYECMLQQQICMGATVSGLLCETKLTGEQFCMLMEIVVECVATEQKPLQYLVHTVVELLRIPPSPASTLVFTTILNVLNSLVARKEILQGVDVSDTLISLLSAYSRNYTNHEIGLFQQEEDVLLMAACFKHLYLCSHADPACLKYYLTSTNIVPLIATVAAQIHPETSRGAMQVLVASLSQLIFALTQEEDLFVYKLSQQVGNVFEMLYSMFPFGGKEYCDMFGWVTVIWWKGRTLLDSTSLGVDIARKALQYGVAGMKAMVSVTYSAKIVLVNSSQLMEILRVAGEQIETVMVKQIKGRKKGSPSKVDHHQQIQQIEETLHLLTALFHSVDHLGETAELARDNVKKVILFMDKNYGFLTEHVGTVYLQALTNLSNSNVFSVWFAAYLSEGHSLMLEDIMTTLGRNDGSSVTPQVKRAFHILRILVPHESARSSVSKCRLLEELIGRLTKSMDEKKAELNLNHFYQVVQLLAALARFKDTSAKIISDKKMLELLLRHLALQRSANLEEKIVILLSNLSCFKGNKAALMANRDLHKVTLGLLSENVPYSSHLVRLIYNLIYKNSAGVKLYRRKEVVEIVERTNEGSEVYRALLDVLTAED